MAAMPDGIAIKVENLSKVYKLYDCSMDRLKESISPFGKNYHHEFRATSGVSFEIPKGETVGIVGRNGSGKSTLLKMITGVLTPTSGTVQVDGKISALLELGAGFNPQLSGLENVYFNGTLMGYTREQMDAKLDEILSFADIGEFIHQPTKTYSSGMFVRLAFAVAINIDPDVLIVDEALSVGDEAFQRKCYARILDFQSRGKTILFVSHSAGAVVELCKKAMLLDQGELLMYGSPKLVVTRYQKLLYAPPEKVALMREEIRELGAQNAASDAADDGKSGAGPKRKQSAPVKEAEKVVAFYEAGLVPKSTVSYESQGASISDPHIVSLSGARVNVLVRGEQYVYTYTVSFDDDAHNVRYAMMIKTTTGLQLGGMVSHRQSNPIGFVPAGSVRKQSFAFRCALMPGAYFLNAGVRGSVNGEEGFLHRIVDAAMFKVLPEPDLLVTGILDFSVDAGHRLKQPSGSHMEQG